MNEKLDDNILYKIFEYLTPESLVAIEKVGNKNWLYICQNHNDLWRPHLDNIWSNIAINRPKNYLLSDRIKLLSIAQLKSALKNIVITECIEKSDYQKLLIAALFLRGRNYPIGFPYKTRLPSWSLNMSLYKSSYYFARKEVRNVYTLYYITYMYTVYTLLWHIYTSIYSHNM